MPLQMPPTGRSRRQRGKQGEAECVVCVRWNNKLITAGLSRTPVPLGVLRYAQ